jgi:hypothetical protein
MRPALSRFLELNHWSPPAVVRGDRSTLPWADRDEDSIFRTLRPSVRVPVLQPLSDAIFREWPNPHFTFPPRGWVFQMHNSENCIFGDA